MENFDLTPNYLRQNFERDDRLGVVLIDRKAGTVEQKIVTAEKIAAEGYQRHLRAANRSGKDVYLTVNALKPEAAGRTKQDVGAIRHVYLDIDENGKAVRDKILNDPKIPPPHHVFESSPGKYQMLWQVNDFTPDRAAQTIKGMALEHGADAAVFDPARVLRAPGFRNWKYEKPHYVKDLPLERVPERIYTPSDFPRYDIARDAPTLRESPRIDGNRASGDTGQSEKDFAYACGELEKGRDARVIQQEIADRRRYDGKHPNPDDYAARTVKKASARVVSHPLPPEKPPSRYQGVER